jgi:hypothetical protein
MWEAFVGKWYLRRRGRLFCWSFAWRLASSYRLLWIILGGSFALLRRAEDVLTRWGGLGKKKLTIWKVMPRNPVRIW